MEGKNIQMNVRISENSIGLLKMASEDMTFYEFFYEIKQFLVALLQDPINAKPSDRLVAHGLSKETLIDKLVKRGIIFKKERIDEPYDQEKKKKISVHHVSYKIPKEGFKDKLRSLYGVIFGN
jgi:hypothetical protein